MYVYVCALCVQDMTDNVHVSHSALSYLPLFNTVLAHCLSSEVSSGAFAMSRAMINCGLCVSEWEMDDNERKGK